MKCAYTGIEFHDPSDGIWEDGEWTSWDYINQFIADNEGWESENYSERTDVNLSTTTLQLWELIHEVIDTAKRYKELTGRHLPVFGELGELYGEVKFGIKRHKPMTQGSDGRLGKDFVEIKTITPGKASDTVLVKRSGNFNRLLIVRINESFEFETKMVDRKSLKKGIGKYIKVSLSKVDTKFP